jgi:hypothetical protein
MLVRGRATEGGREGQRGERYEMGVESEGEE